MNTVPVATVSARPELRPESSVTTSFEQVEAIAQHLTSRKHAWAQVGIPERIEYLRRCMDGVMAAAEAWAEAACIAKGIDPATNLAWEEWFAGPAITLWNLRLLVEALQAGGQPKPSQVRWREGQAIAQVFPDNGMDWLLWLGFRGEIWMQPGQAPTQGLVYRKSEPQDSHLQGKLALVLGAGNVSAIAPMDALYKLFAENQVVLLKMNPVNAYVGPFLEQAFQPLRQDGFFEVVYGGTDLGQHLCQHPLVDTIHITGSHRTHDAIVWGSTPAEQEQRKATNQPINSRTITSELGCVTPVLVVPGKWSKSDLEFQARQLAGAIVHNASFNCASAKVVVTAKNWAQREEFLAALHRELANTPARAAYYSGAAQRYQAFLDRYPQAQAIEKADRQPAFIPHPPSPTLPWTILPDVPARLGEYALTEEAFCGVLAEVSLEAADTGEFLQRAVEFANQQVWGNLSCALLVDPVTQRQYVQEVETAIATLRYGAIGVNVWSAILFSIPVLSWGAFPGNPLTDIGSGQGVVHNTYLFEYPQKSVLYAPFHIRPLPVWVTRHGNPHQVVQRFTRFQRHPSWQLLSGIVLAALRG
jgi:acyl-CoA reductase-like NAD-dependent aldehyde dehydrogenase